METFIALCGFAGSWALVAGSIYQASLELQDEVIARDRLEETRKQLPEHEHVSVWWWLLPPAKIYLERRNENQWRHTFLEALPDEDVESLIAYLNKATGWLFVGSGGLLLALKENYELLTIHHISMIWFWILSVVMLLLCISFTIRRTQHSKQILGKKRD